MRQISKQSSSCFGAFLHFTRTWIGNTRVGPELKLPLKEESFTMPRMVAAITEIMFWRTIQALCVLCSGQHKGSKWLAGWHTIYITIRKCYLGVIVLKCLGGKHLQCWHVALAFVPNEIAPLSWNSKGEKQESLHALCLLRASKMLLPSNRASECLQLCACCVQIQTYCDTFSSAVPPLAKKISACIF